WIRLAGERVAFQGLPARICWLGYGERHLAGLRFNELVARGEISAPIVIGRDHLDTGSVASPYRETEGMADGSDAIADWPLLNALVNTASGATWVSIHHGGGVGIGRSIHAGQVSVADGTELAAGSPSSPTGPATCGRGPATRTPTGPAWCSAATSTRCPTAVRSTGRSASCRRSRRSTSCAPTAPGSTARSASPASPTRRAPA